MSYLFHLFEFEWIQENYSLLILNTHIAPQATWALTLLFKDKLKGFGESNTRLKDMYKVCKVEWMEYEDVSVAYKHIPKAYREICKVYGDVWRG